LNQTEEISSHFFSVGGSSVKIHSTTTGLVVSTLTPPPPINGNFHSDILTSVVINPHNAFQLFTASLDGRVIIWDFVNAILLQTVDIGQPIHHMCAHEQFNGSVFVAVSRPQSGNGE
jgi:NET1-associated nuclear protein 1 (U3 small nucleolar RNA-associated protein 17)